MTGKLVHSGQDAGNETCSTDQVTAGNIFKAMQTWHLTLDKVKAIAVDVGGDSHIVIAAHMYAGAAIHLRVPYVNERLSPLGRDWWVAHRP